jgi:signal peptidase II
MEALRSRKYLICTLVALTVITIDQYTKYLIIQSFALHHSLTVIQNFFDLVHTRNRGIAFGLFAGQGSGTQTIVLIVTSCLAISFIFYLLSSVKGKQLYPTITLSLILGGAIGNLIDRIRWGVVDFLDLHWYHYHWPAFNAADAAISTGLVLLVIGLLTKKFPSP